MSYGMTVTLAVPFEDAVRRAREALAAQGFGVLTEIDVTETMKRKLDADIERYVILGACNPPLALRALDADRSIGLLLPCNVVVRADADGRSVVEVLDPQVMSQVSDADGLEAVADEAVERLKEVVADLASGATAA
jgi:uncharacterized protein (DUF302 family)